MKAKPSVHLHIERLVVDDSLVAGTQPAKLRAAIEAELVQLITGNGLNPPAESALARVTTEFHVHPGGANAQIARAVYNAVDAGGGKR